MLDNTQTQNANYILTDIASAMKEAHDTYLKGAAAEVRLEETKKTNPSDSMKINNFFKEADDSSNKAGEIYSGIITKYGTNSNLGILKVVAEAYRMRFNATATKAMAYFVKGDDDKGFQYFDKSEEEARQYLSRLDELNKLEKKNEEKGYEKSITDKIEGNIDKFYGFGDINN